jgi:high-affinity iron transporter
MPKESLVAGLLAGTVGFDTTTSWLQLAGWLTYVGFTLSAYLSSPKKVKSPLNA